jgi:hypothetical protein
VIGPEAGAVHATHVFAAADHAGSHEKCQQVDHSHSAVAALPDKIENSSPPTRGGMYSPSPVSPDGSFQFARTPENIRNKFPP